VWGARLEQTVERSVHLGCCSQLDRTMMRQAKDTKQRQREQEADHEKEQEDMKAIILAG